MMVCDKPLPPLPKRSNCQNSSACSDRITPTYPIQPPDARPSKRANPSLTVTSKTQLSAPYKPGLPSQTLQSRRLFQSPEPQPAPLIPAADDTTSPSPNKPNGFKLWKSSKTHTTPPPVPVDGKPISAKYPTPPPHISRNHRAPTTPSGGPGGKGNLVGRRTPLLPLKLAPSTSSVSTQPPPLGDVANLDDPHEPSPRPPAPGRQTRRIPSPKSTTGHSWITCDTREYSTNTAMSSSSTSGGSIYNTSPSGTIGTPSDFLGCSPETPKDEVHFPPASPSDEPSPVVGVSVVIPDVPTQQRSLPSAYTAGRSWVSCERFEIADRPATEDCAASSTFGSTKAVLADKPAIPRTSAHVSSAASSATIVDLDPKAIKDAVVSTGEVGAHSEVGVVGDGLIRRDTHVSRSTTGPALSQRLTELSLHAVKSLHLSTPSTTHRLYVVDPVSRTNATRNTRIAPLIPNLNKRLPHRPTRYSQIRRLVKDRLYLPWRGVGRLTGAGALRLAMNSGCLKDGGRKMVRRCTFPASASPFVSPFPMRSLYDSPEPPLRHPRQSPPTAGTSPFRCPVPDQLQHSLSTRTSNPPNLKPHRAPSALPDSHNKGKKAPPTMGPRPLQTSLPGNHQANPPPPRFSHRIAQGYRGSSVGSTASESAWSDDITVHSLPGFTVHTRGQGPKWVPFQVTSGGPY